VRWRLRDPAAFVGAVMAQGTGSICVGGFLGAHPWLHFQGVSLGELGEPDPHLGDPVGNPGSLQISTRKRG